MQTGWPVLSLPPSATAEHDLLAGRAEGRAAQLPPRSRRVLVRVRVQIMGPGKYGNVGKSQSVLITIHPILFTHTRRYLDGLADGHARVLARNHVVVVGWSDKLGSILKVSQNG
eukprot:COSAG01_NODE_1021_length_12074_cov_7.519876_9_plen_114_part_00